MITTTSLMLYANAMRMLCECYANAMRMLIAFSRKWDSIARWNFPMHRYWPSLNKEKEYTYPWYAPAFTSHCTLPDF